MTRLRMRWTHSGLSCPRTRHLDDDIVERLAGDDSFDRILPDVDKMVVAVIQLKVLAILADGSPERGHRLDAVHRQRRVVRPRERLVRLNQDDAVRQSRDDQPATGSVRRSVSTHAPDRLSLSAPVTKFASTSAVPSRLAEKRTGPVAGIAIVRSRLRLVLGGMDARPGDAPIMHAHPGFVDIGWWA